MKTLSTLFFILVITLYLGIIQVFTQEKTKLKEVVIFEFLIPNREEFEKVEIPIPNKYNEGVGFKEENITECNNINPENCKDFVNTSYGISVESAKLSKSSAQIIFKIEDANGCKARKIFAVTRNKTSKFKLKCGVTLIAYYGFETKEAN